MLHELIKVWFGWVENWGYLGVFVLMALESSIVPVPSEVVIPPAAYWASQGRMTLSGVVLAGTLGSWFGSAVSYWVSRWVGLPLVLRYGKVFFLPPEKLVFAEQWVSRHGLPGVFIARLLPVVRHLISIPAGILKMRFVPFSVVTTVGAGAWCAILAWFGQRALGAHPELLQSPETMVAAIKSELHVFVFGAVAFAALYGLVLWVQARSEAARRPSGTPLRAARPGSSKSI
jgi:membrane protein DedA with SNARE-associated domain